MIVKYIEKGIPFDFKRIDKIKTVFLEKTWKSGGLLYGYKDRFNIITIPICDIIETEE